MVEGDVTINASPKSAILGDEITFTGRVLIDGSPVSAGITIYLDNAPAPPTTLASGDSGSDGYYSIKWTSNYKGSLPIYARAATYAGYNSPTIIVPIVEAGVEVHLEPRLHNALLEFRYRSYGLDEFVYSQYSVLGRTAWPQGSFTLYDLYDVRFPPQTVGGVSYLEARTQTFGYQSAPYVFTLELQEVEPVQVLTLLVDKTTGYPGDTFTFSGVLTENGSPLAGELVTLYDQFGMVGTDVTDVNGEYIIEWTPWLIGSYSLYVEAL